MEFTGPQHLQHKVDTARGSAVVRAAPTIGQPPECCAWPIRVCICMHLRLQSQNPATRMTVLLYGRS